MAKINLKLKKISPLQILTDFPVEMTNQEDNHSPSPCHLERSREIQRKRKLSLTSISPEHLAPQSTNKFSKTIIDLNYQIKKQIYHLNQKSWIKKEYDTSFPNLFSVFFKQKTPHHYGHYKINRRFGLSYCAKPNINLQTRLQARRDTQRNT